MKKLFIVIFIIFSINVKAYTSSDAEYNHGYIMPDLYNTGYTSSFDELVDIEIKYPDINCYSGLCDINKKFIEKYGSIIDGFKTDKMIRINAVDNVTIKNFYINNNTWYGINVVAYNGDKYPENILIENGEIMGTKAAAINGSNITVKKMYIHDYGNDAFKIGSNQYIISNYITSGGLGDGAHADGAQLSFGPINNVNFFGNRFDMIGFNSIDGKKYKANAIFFLSLEKGDASNINIKYNWINGGGYTVYFAEAENSNLSNITFQENIIGNGYRFGYYCNNYNKLINGYDTQIYMDDVNLPNIGSIVYLNNNSIINNLDKVNNQIKVIVNSSNYTSNEQIILVKVELYDYNNKLISSKKQTTTLIKNMKGKEFANKQNISFNMFPKDIKTTLTIDLPNDINGYYIKTTAYKNDENGTILRTSKIINTKPGNIKSTENVNNKQNNANIKNEENNNVNNVNNKQNNTNIKNEENNNVNNKSEEIKSNNNTNENNVIDNSNLEANNDKTDNKEMIINETNNNIDIDLIGIIIIAFIEICVAIIVIIKHKK